MTTELPQADAGDVPCAAHELETLRNDWWWFLLLGIALIVLGTISLGSAYFVSVVTITLFGVLLLIGGAGQIISSFWAGKWSGFLLHMLIGIFYAVAGYLIIDAPEEGALAMTLLISAFLIVGGIFRIVAALAIRFHDWGWVLLNGIVTLLLGVLINEQWPASGLWVIGVFVGIEMIFNGWSWVMLSVGLRRIMLAGEA